LYKYDRASEPDAAGLLPGDPPRILESFANCVPGEVEIMVELTVGALLLLVAVLFVARK